MRDALELFPFSLASIQKIGSMRAWPRYLAGFAGKSAALMLEASSSVRSWARHRCPFKRKESGWTYRPCPDAVLAIEDPLPG
ncbi:MAG: hypothetical protein BMS9Abin05_2625 [Rhodothermia bacterium]|nr:MAG: hypothetical protein BMS9Abin05_2625 [Rhodothermia bacterium]